MHKKASNIGCWGELARIPVGIILAKHYYNYVTRASAADTTTLLHQAYSEQSNLLLPWLIKARELETSFSPSNTLPLSGCKNPGNTLLMNCTQMFTSIWEGALSKSPKLSFLHELKQNWGNESYISDLPFSTRKQLTRLRISAHRLPVETGRYARPIIPTTERFCELCKKCSRGNIFGDEKHLLLNCVATDKVNLNHKPICPPTITNLLDKFKLKNNELRNFARYVKDVYEIYLNDTRPSLK